MQSAEVRVVNSELEWYRSRHGQGAVRDNCKGNSRQSDAGARRGCAKVANPRKFGFHMPPLL